MSRESAPAGRPGPDRWAEGRALLRAADPRMAALVDADPGLDPDAFFDQWAGDLWSSLVLQVIGQEISLAAAGAIRGRLQALCGGRFPTPAEMLALDEDSLRGIGLSRAKVVYLHDIAARFDDGRIDVERLRTLDDDAARSELDAPLKIAEADAIGERFRPWRTLAAVYLLTADLGAAAGAR